MTLSINRGITAQSHQLAEDMCALAGITGPTDSQVSLNKSLWFIDQAIKLFPVFPFVSTYSNMFYTVDDTIVPALTIPTQPDTVVLVDATFIARRTSGSAGTPGDNGIFKISMRYSNHSGMLLMDDPQTSFQFSDQIIWTIHASGSGQNIVLAVNGSFDNNIHWLAFALVTSFN